MKFIEDIGGKVETIHKFKFEIPYMFKFHKKPKVRIDVDLYVIRRLYEAQHHKRGRQPSRSGSCW